MSHEAKSHVTAAMRRRRLGVRGERKADSASEDGEEVQRMETGTASVAGMMRLADTASSKVSCASTLAGTERGCATPLENHGRVVGHRWSAPVVSTPALARELDVGDGMVAMT
eukprot:157795-Rhodomonas_salina.1